MLTEESLEIRNAMKKTPQPSMNSVEYLLLFKFLMNVPLVRVSNLKSERNITKRKRIQIQSKFVPENVMKVSTYTEVQKVRFQIGDTNITLHIYSKEDASYFVKEIIPIIQFVVCLFGVPSKSITFYYYLLDVKKEIRKNMSYMYLGREQVNSGSCSTNYFNSTITIWRKEEIVKVTIHEMIHALVREQVEDSSELINHYQKKYNMTSPKVKIDETYTEIWANILNVFLLSMKVPEGETPDMNDKYNLFLDLLQTEKQFCHFQSQKVKDILNIREGKNVKKIDINKETNVLAYYIIRCEVFTKLPAFLKLCRENNEDYIFMKNKELWFSILMKLIQRKKMKKIYPITNLLSTTMRMSAIELKVFY